MSAEIHHGAEHSELGTATFVKPGPGAGNFTVDATAELVMEILKSGCRDFEIVIEQITTPPSKGAWSYRLLSADCINSQRLFALMCLFIESPPAVLDGW